VRTAKAHPVAGWLRVEGRIYSATLDRILSDRDKQMLDDPSSSGLPPASRDWFWSWQLPRLVSDLKIREQVIERQAALAARRQAIEDQIRLQAGVLIEERAAIDAEVALLEQVLM